MLCGGVRAVRVHQRHHRPVLPPVRADDRRLDGHLGVQLADAQPGPGGHPAAAARRAEGPRSAGCSTCCWAGSSGCSTGRFRRGTDGYTRLVGWLLRGSARGAGRLRRAARADLVDFDAAADRLHPGAGQGPILRRACSCPTRPRWSGPQAVVDRIERDRPRRRRASATRSPIAGQSFVAAAPTARTSARCSSSSTTFDERRDPRPDARRHRRPRLRRAARQGGARRPWSSSSAPPPVSGPGRRPAASSSWSRTAATSAWTSCRSRPTASIGRLASRAAGSTACSRSLPRQHAAAVRRRRPRPSARRMGVDARRRLRHAAGLPRLALRQRLQPLRPHLAGDRPGRAASSATTPTTIKLLKVRNADGEMVPLGAAGRRHARSAGRSSSTRYNMYPAAADQRQRRARASAPARPSRRWSGWPTTSCRRAMAFEWTELTLHRRSRPATRRCIVFALAVVMRLPGAGGAVRELVAAAGGHPGRADVPALRGRPACSWRSSDINIFTQIGFVVLVGPGEQERDPDRRVRQARARGGRADRARRRWRRAGCGCGRS